MLRTFRKEAKAGRSFSFAIFKGPNFNSQHVVFFKRASDGRDIPGMQYSQPAATRAGVPTCAYLDDSTIVAMRIDCSDDLARLTLRYGWP